jgi:hypothetical protein
MNKVPWSIVVVYFKYLRCYQILHNFFIPLFKKKNDIKVFNIGYLKTGTTTMAKALSILGYRSVQWLRTGKEPKEGWIDHIKKSNYDAFSDAPVGRGAFYKKLDEEFPKSKFILTIRDKESFIISVINYFKGSPWEKKTIQDSKQIIREYEERNRQIIEYFKDRPNDFLVMNIINEDGWDKLCNFLDKPIPKKPFPHKNIGRSKKILIEN